MSEATLVREARAGDRHALERLLGLVRDDVYNLSLRMLWHPQDAEDATQEILVKVITQLASFRGEARFTTWAYRIAANHLLTTRKRRLELQALTFDVFAADLADGLADPADHGLDEQLLEEEVKIGCTNGMLLCLDREHRLAYVLGEVFQLRSQDAAGVLGIDPAAYRKRLQRARDRLARFMRGNCGIVNPENQCRCRRRIEPAIATGRVDPERLQFANAPQAREGVREMDQLRDAAAVFRSHPRFRAPDTVVQEITRLLESGRYRTIAGGR